MDDFEMLLMTLSTLLSTSLIFILNTFTKKITNRQDRISHDLVKIIVDNNDTVDSISKSKDSKQEQEINIIKNAKFDDNIEKLIQDHHKQAILQSNVQFWFSLIASVTGFIFIIIIITCSTSLTWYEYIVKIVPGIIIEAVSVLFFSQSKETRERATNFLNKLRQDRQFTKSIKLVESIEDENLRSEIKAQIALNMCNIEK